ncbi:hypothetical protein Sjap_003198 [Stephania japonica]|uniref:Uncharacterized protein n=1 Tax=Stephania japonica TaxID=461633 RepID=A0AAP0KPV2_9MAGN
MDHGPATPSRWDSIEPWLSTKRAWARLGTTRRSPYPLEKHGPHSLKRGKAKLRRDYARYGSWGKAMRDEERRLNVAGNSGIRVRNVRVCYSRVALSASRDTDRSSSKSQDKTDQNSVHEIMPPTRRSHLPQSVTDNQLVQELTPPSRRKIQQLVHFGLALGHSSSIVPRLPTDWRCLNFRICALSSSAVVAKPDEIKITLLPTKLIEGKKTETNGLCKKANRVGICLLLGGVVLLAKRTLFLEMQCCCTSGFKAGFVVPSQMRTPSKYFPTTMARKLEVKGSLPVVDVSKGKTLAFGIPALMHVLCKKKLEDSGRACPWCFVLSPIREIVQQVSIIESYLMASKMLVDYNERVVERNGSENASIVRENDQVVSESHLVESSYGVKVVGWSERRPRDVPQDLCVAVDEGVMAGQPEISDSGTGDVQGRLDGMSQMITSHDQHLQEIIRLLRTQATTLPTTSAAPITQSRTRGECVRFTRVCSRVVIVQVLTFPEGLTFDEWVVSNELGGAMFVLFEGNIFIPHPTLRDIDPAICAPDLIISYPNPPGPAIIEIGRGILCSEKNTWRFESSQCHSFMSGRPEYQSNEDNGWNHGVSQTVAYNMNGDIGYSPRSISVIVYYLAFK